MLFGKLRFKIRGNCPNFKMKLQSFTYAQDFKQKTPYEILGVTPTSSTKEIKAAYVKLCKRLHPDMKPGDNSQHEKFIELNKAYNILINPKARKLHYRKDEKYDAEQHSQQYDYKSYRTRTHTSQEKPWYEEEEYKNQFKRNFQSGTVKKRVPEVWIFVGCASLLFFSLLLSVSRYYLYRKAEDKSRRISKIYAERRKKLQND